MGKVFRIGVMGYNATGTNIALTLHALGEGLKYSKNNKAKL